MATTKKGVKGRLNPRYSHGHCMERSPTYVSWSGMRYRCNNKNCQDYHNYGGRGIRVCDRWNSFVNFLADMGECPPAGTIERIDVNGHYEPSNCRWATKTEQGQNTRRVRLTLEMADRIREEYAAGAYPSAIAMKYGVCAGTVGHVIANRSWVTGYTVEKRKIVNSGSRKLSVEQVALVRSSRESARIVAERLGVCRDTIERIRRGETYAVA